MANPWALLGKERLNDIVGEQRLSRLGQLLPAIQEVYDPLVIHSNDGLAKIFNAFVGAEQMEKLTFRKEFFNLPNARDAQQPHTPSKPRPQHRLLGNTGK